MSQNNRIASFRTGPRWACARRPVVAVLVVAVGIVLSQTCNAGVVSLPEGAAQTAQIAEPLASDVIATGPFGSGATSQKTVEGQLTRTAWRIRGTDQSALQLITALRDELASSGFKILYQCQSDACGGFDFRYALQVISEPEMHVDLGDFCYLSAERKSGKGTENVTLLVSRSNDSGFVQMTQIMPYDATMAMPAGVPVGPSVSASVPSVTPMPVAMPFQGGSLASQLDGKGTVPLDDLVFETGSAALDPGPFASLDALAAYLVAHPDRQITLVGHTDAVGPLDINIAISRKRAQAVVDRLVKSYGVNPAQVAAQGVGFLAPRASNLTDAGRTENRRVEAMLASTR